MTFSPTDSGNDPNRNAGVGFLLQGFYFRVISGLSCFSLAGALHVTADELLGIKPQPREASKFEQVTSDPESMRLWKRFQRITLLPERDQRAVIRLINSLTGATGADAHD